MSREEINSTFSLLTLAGSETTATLLSGCTFYLLKNPAVYVKLRKDSFAAFKDDSEIRIDSVNHLPYLKAVLDESLRIYPPAPTALNRVVAYPGHTISRYFVPGGIPPAYSIPLGPELHSSGLLHPRALAPRACGGIHGRS